MSLHNGVDTMAVASIGVYTSNYGAATPGNIANLFASLGLLEDAPEGSLVAIARGLFRMGLSMVLS